MSDSQNLKRILKSKNIKIKDLGRMTQISPTTLYSIIDRDSNIRYDIALKIAKAISIEPKEICSDPLAESDDIILPYDFDSNAYALGMAIKSMLCKENISHEEREHICRQLQLGRAVEYYLNHEDYNLREIIK